MFTLIVDVVAPVDQEYATPPVAVKFTLPPAQKVVGPLAEIVGVGSGLTVTVTRAHGPMDDAQLPSPRT